jgi:micrococcal nuclease
VRNFGLGLLLIVALAACACTEAEQESGAPQTAAPVATTTPRPRDTAWASPAVTTGQVSPSSTASVVSPAGEQAQAIRVVDGDTIEVSMAGTTYRVRYIGVDTPETVDPRRPVGCYGREASERNRQLVEGKTVELEKDVSETDKYDRLLRYVWVDGEMVNATLVREGYAMASTYPPDVKYQELFQSLQQEARDAGRGLWGPACIPTPVAPGVCDYSGTDQPVIKGNISRSTGEKIYHVPGGEFYDETVIDEAAGERWFCTEQKAVAAGWRKSKQ